MEDKFSVRWGTPYLEAGFTVIPNLILRNYARLGLTAQECMLVIHIASYKYENANSQAYPSVSTIAQEMGLSKRWVLTLLARIEQKGLLRIIRRDGQPSVYDISPLAQKCLELAQSAHAHDHASEEGSEACTIVQGGEVEFTAPVNSTSPVPVNSSSPEEKNVRKENKNNNNGGGVVVSNQPPERKELHELAITTLRSRGISEEVARRLAQSHPLQRILEVSLAADRSPGVKDKAAWIIRALEGDWAVGVRAAHPYDNQAYRELEELLRQGRYIVRDPITGEIIHAPGRR